MIKSRKCRINKIRLATSIDATIFSTTATILLAAIIEKDKSFIFFIAIAVVGCFIGVLLIIFQYLFIKPRSHNQIQMAYTGEFSRLIEELRIAGIYYRKQIGDYYIFDSKRLLVPDIRFLLIKEQEKWVLSSELSAWQSLEKLVSAELFTLVLDSQILQHEKASKK